MPLAAAAQVSADAGTYIHWGVISISLTNLLIIAAMVLVFVLAVLLPFPRGVKLPEQRREEQ